MRALARIGSSSIGRSQMPQINQLAENWYFASQLFWLTLIFGAVFVVIGLGMYPKIEAPVDARDRKVADDLAAAKAAHAAADHLDRTGVVSGERVSAREALGGGRL